MQLQQNEIHVWSADLNISAKLENDKLILLNSDERKQAERFHNNIHKKRYIAAHSTLRQILSFYVNILPQQIFFSRTEYNKPYLENSRLQFNMSHSHDIAVYAISLDNMIGVDIEEIKTKYTPEIVKRYFSQQENSQFNQLSDEEKLISFYRIWARKEALIKAIGKGLAIPLSTFSVSLQDDYEKIRLENESSILIPLSIHPNFQAALATNIQQITAMTYWQFVENLPTLTKTISFTTTKGA